MDITDYNLLKVSFCTLRLSPFEDLVLKFPLPRESLSVRRNRGSSVSRPFLSHCSLLLAFHIRMKATTAIHIAMTAAIKAKSVVKGMSWIEETVREVLLGEGSVVESVENKSSTKVVRDVWAIDLYVAVANFL